MQFKLNRLSDYKGVKGPLLLIIMDGMGLYRGEKDGYPGNAIDIAAPRNLYRLMKSEKIVTRLKAHGTAVGMPSDRDQGNSEVGHNAMGAAGYSRRERNLWRTRSRAAASSKEKPGKR